MKNFLFCFCLLISSFGFGQGYIPIFEGYDSVRWNNVYRWVDMFDPIAGTNTIVSTVDSLIFNNGKEYRIYRKWIKSIEFLVREDTLKKQIYARTFDDPLEYLVYDFSVEVGDEFYLTVFNGRKFEQSFDCIAIVDSIKTDFIFNKNRKLIKFKILNIGSNSFGCPEDLVWIEGIGTNLGLDYFDSSYLSTDQGDTELQCLHKNGEEIFSLGRCYIDTIFGGSTLVEGFYFENNFTLIPNPTDNQLLIKTTNQNLLSGKIKITNLSGQLLFEKEVNFQSEIRIEEVEKLKAGIYFISLETKESFAVKKFMKN